MLGRTHPLWITVKCKPKSPPCRSHRNTRVSDSKWLREKHAFHAKHNKSSLRSIYQKAPRIAIIFFNNTNDNRVPGLIQLPCSHPIQLSNFYRVVCETRRNHSISGLPIKGNNSVFTVNSVIHISLEFHPCCWPPLRRRPSALRAVV